jgi:hypothetical protein
MEIKKNFEEQNMSVIMHLLVLTTIIISNDVPVPNILKLVGFLNFWLQANFMKVIPETRRSHWNTCIYVLITHLVWFMVFNATFNNISVFIMAGSFIGRGNRSTQRKPPMFIEYTSPERSSNSQH